MLENRQYLLESLIIISFKTLCFRKGFCYFRDINKYISQLSTLISEHVAKTTNTTLQKTNIVLNLLKEGATVPFIARYRKDQTGGLEDHEIFAIQKQVLLLKNFLKEEAVF